MHAHTDRVRTEGTHLSMPREHPFAKWELKGRVEGSDQIVILTERDDIQIGRRPRPDATDEGALALGEREDMPLELPDRRWGRRARERPTAGHAAIA